MRGDRPLGPRGRHALPDIGVFVDVIIIIEVHKVVINRLAEGNTDRKEKQAQTASGLQGVRIWGAKSDARKEDGQDIFRETSPRISKYIPGARFTYHLF